jgi:hypothetical protein
MSDGSPATDIAAPGELAAAPFVSQQHAVPQVVIVARDIEKGTRVIGFRRTIDPPMDTPLPALPGTITITAPKTKEPEEPATPDDAVEPADPADATGSPRPPSDTPAPGC